MRLWLSSLLLLLPAVPAAKPQPRVKFFPEPQEVFPRLLADPRQASLGASYYRLGGRDLADVALGHAWGLARWRGREDLSRLWQLDIEGMAVSRFHVKGGVNEFETVDFAAALPLTLRRGDVSFKGSLFHESSHLGDDYIRRTGDKGFRYSTEGLRLLAALEPHPALRLYGGAAYLLHTVPAPQRWSAQAGAELMSGDMGWSARVPLRLFAGQDVQWKERVGWNPHSRTVAGVRVGFRESRRAVRVQGAYTAGRSAYSQFFRRHERYAELSVAFEL